MRQYSPCLEVRCVPIARRGHLELAIGEVSEDAQAIKTSILAGDHLDFVVATL